MHGSCRRRFISEKSSVEIQLKLNISDELLNGDGGPVSREVLEQVVAEGYRSGRLTIVQVRKLLGFGSRFETEDFLHRHKAIEYSVEDLQRDLEGLKDLGLR